MSTEYQNHTDPLLDYYERDCLRRIGAFVAGRNSWSEFEHEIIQETSALYDPTPQGIATTDTLVQHADMTDAQQLEAQVIRARAWKTDNAREDAVTAVLGEASVLESHTPPTDSAITPGDIVQWLLHLDAPVIAHEKLRLYHDSLEKWRYRALLQDVGVSYCVNAQKTADLAVVPAIISELKAEDPAPEIRELRRGWGIFSWTTQQRYVDTRQERLHKRVKGHLNHAQDRLAHPENYTIPTSYLAAESPTPTAKSYFLEIYKEHGLEAALRAAGVHRKVNPSSLDSAYALLASEFANIGDIEACKHMTTHALEAATADGTNIAPWKRHTITSPLMALYARRGELSEAHALATNLPADASGGPDKRSQAHRIVAEEFLRGRAFEAAADELPLPPEATESAIMYVHTTLPPEHHTNAFENMLTTLGEKGCTEAIRRIAKELPPEKQQKHPQITRDAMVAAHIYNHDYTAALELLDYYPDVFRTQDVLRAIVRHKAQQS